MFRGPRSATGIASTTLRRDAWFPSFYGRNIEAWIGCLTYRDEDDGMTAVVVPPGEVLTLQLDEARVFAARSPEQYADLIECSAFANW